MDLPGILWCWRVGCRWNNLCDFQASTQEEGEIFQLLKDLFLQICHHGEFLARKTSRGTLFFFLSAVFWAESSFKPCLTWFTGWKWLNDNIIKILDARHRMSTTWNVTIQSVELFAVVASGAGVDGNLKFRTFSTWSIRTRFVNSLCATKHTQIFLNSLWQQAVQLISSTLPCAVLN